MSSVERDDRNADNASASSDFITDSDVAGSTTESQCSTASSSSSTIAAALEAEEKLAGKMFSTTRELVCFLLAITFTALAAYTHSTAPKVSKPPPAKPFFNQSSLVIDFYKGHLSAMVDRVADSDYSFIMYYAPWDAESQAARQQFEIAAQYYQNEVYFAAINCWHPGSECRTQYNKIHSFPVLMLYPLRDPGVQYKGILSAPYIIRFIDAVMNPVFRITNKRQLVQLLIDYDAVVVGYFDFNGITRSPGYKEFYKCALQSLRRDPNRELAFAVVTDKGTAERDYGVVKQPSASLLMWNESLSYPEDQEWSSESILTWISSAIHQAALWLQPPGVKSLTFAPYLREGPVLFLFTPRNPLHKENYNYNLLREVGLAYYNCADNPVVRQIVKYLQRSRVDALTSHYRETQRCKELLSESKEEATTPVVASVSVQNWINSSCCSAKTSAKKCDGDNVCILPAQRIEQVCKETDVFHLTTRFFREEIGRYEYHCEKSSEQSTAKSSSEASKTKKDESLLSESTDTRSSSEIKKMFERNRCKMLLTGNKYNRPVFPRESPDHPPFNLTDQVCKTNKSLALIAVDSIRYGYFAESLGIDISKRKDKTAVVIVDSTQESQYVMQGDLSRHSLVNFINNYTYGTLVYSLRSEQSRRYSQKFKTRKTCDSVSGSKICIPELTTDNFLSAIMDPAKDVIVMYHSPYCAFCSAIAYVYLSVAHYLLKMDHLSLVRIDGENNDLPWGYRMNRYPSILFFPARRKEDSTVYPHSLPITIPNLLNFVLANLNDDSKIEAMIYVCEVGIGEAPNTCLWRIRWLCLRKIESLSQELRKLRRNVERLDRRLLGRYKRIILLKLKHVREVHLILNFLEDLSTSSDKVRLLQKKFSVYYKRLSTLRHQSNKTRSDESGKSKRTEKPVKDEL